MSVNFKGRDSIPDFMERVANAGHSIRFVDNVMYVSNPLAVQAMVDAYTVKDAIKPLIARVKAEAMSRILAILPEWKQSNCNARMNEFNEKRLLGEKLTTVEEAELVAMRALWSAAKAIRAASDAHEAALQSLQTFSEVTAYNTESGWPD